ncbi:hypothetical protein L2E82_43238 [Cichorium intybus]|uniref:Uncharacterized protein n=1 Tax=Cichorium intybus TaxID=13427 RepID=A0ACB8ZN61_CICIN|nr:hypothetical protein L2E82_43238 [Cichorium intybus]
MSLCRVGNGASLCVWGRSVIRIIHLCLLHHTFSEARKPERPDAELVQAVNKFKVDFDGQVVSLERIRCRRLRCKRDDVEDAQTRNHAHAQQVISSDRGYYT